MKESRSTFVALVLVFGLISAGCTIQAPAGGSPLGAQPAATAQAQPTSSAETEASSVPAAGEEAERETNPIFDLPTNLDGYVDLSVDQLHEIMAEHNFTLVNVHIPYEGELPETDLFIAYNEIADHQAELPAKDAPIVLYCRTGPMSTQAAKTLAGLGYSRVYELDGGFDAWAAANYELLKK